DDGSHARKRVETREGWRQKSGDSHRREKQPDDPLGQRMFEHLSTSPLRYALEAPNPAGHEWNGLVGRDRTQPSLPPPPWQPERSSPYHHLGGDEHRDDLEGVADAAGGQGQSGYEHQQHD